MSEGWGDFNALLLMLRAGDNLDGTFAEAIYVSHFMGDSGYFGLRRAPYSTDMTKNPFTFKHIMDSAALPTTAPPSPAPSFCARFSLRSSARSFSTSA